MCINCDESSTEIPAGIQGIQGNAGNDGIFGGFSGEWLFSTSTSTGPAATFLRFNNATYSAVTQIYVADLNISSIDYDLFLDSLSNGGSFGYVRIFKEFDSSKFWLGEITAVTDNGTDHTIAVTYILSNGAFAANDNLVLSFAPKGSFPTTQKQRINTIFRQSDTPYVSHTAASYLDIGTVVWDINTFGYPVTAKLVVKPNVIGHTYKIRLIDNSTNVLWDTTFVAAANTKQVIDLGARLISPVAAIKYIQIEAYSDGANALQVQSIDLYNQ